MGSRAEALERCWERALPVLYVGELGATKDREFVSESRRRGVYSIVKLANGRYKKQGL